MKRFVVNLLMGFFFPIISLSSYAYDFEVDGIYYNITSMSNLEVGVTYYNNTDHNTTYSGDFVIPQNVNYNNKTFTVTSIERYAFGGLSTGCKITSIEIPVTVTKIRDGAFRNCMELKKISLPPSLMEIEFYCFQNTAIEEITIPNSVYSIGLLAISDCPLLRAIILGSGLKRVEPDAFADNPKLVEVFLFTEEKPSGLSFSTFRGSHNALEIYVPSTKTYGFGKEYISFVSNTFIYSGQAHNIEWTNNLKAYKCEIPESDCMTKENNAGKHTQYLTATYSNGIDFSVKIPYDYTINKAPMTLSVNNVQREYGEPNPAFSCNISGWVGSDNEASVGVTPSFDCDATQRSNVGDYRILASLDAPNYDITYSYGTLSIVKAPLVASVVNSSKIYGNPNPQFDLSFSGLKNGETAPLWEVKPTFNTAVTQKTPVGEYEVTASNGVSTNYDISAYKNGILTITKRDITAKANDCERLYGEENPEFKTSFIGFVNGDSLSDFTELPVSECVATKDSNAGKYPITVNGGSSQNYNFIYQDGTLTVNPLTIGFKDVYNSVTFNDMSVSTTDDYFYFVPEIFGPYNEEDFWLELMALDKDNRYPSQHILTISGGEYSGDYINYSTVRLEAGKYIFNLTPKGTNTNVVANPSRAYVTVNRASNNLEWDVPSPIKIKVGEKIELGISYDADLWCDFNTDYDEEVISLSSERATDKDPHWYATGLKEGATTLHFSIECKKNDFGFYDFSNSPTLYKRIVVEGIFEEDGVEEIIDASDKTITVYTLQGVRMNVSRRDELSNLPQGIYIVNGKKEIVK